MSMNKFMHPRNIYRLPPSFHELSLQCPEFEKYVSRKPNGKILFDFKNPAALRCLTQILLRKDFGLYVTIPENKLIPTLPLRLNYILWIEDLLNWIDEKKFPVSGIDIGTGATCIYPLLASKKNGWKMIGTDINASSVETARENVKKNLLDHLISVKEVCKSAFLDGVVEPDVKYDFCMCNPPFFNSDIEIGHTNSDSDSSCVDDDSCLGTADELLSAGGEVAFVKSIIEDSLKLQNQINIYTTMIGHKSSLAPLLEELKKHNVQSVSQTEFCQGRTVRWAIAWTLTDNTLKNYSPLSLFKLPKPITWLFEPKQLFSECAELVIPQLLSQLKIESVLLEDFKKRKLWRITAVEDTWTGARKKRRERSRNEKNATEAVKSDGETKELPAFDQKDAPIPENSNKTEFTPSNSTNEVKNPFLCVKPRIKESCPKNDYCRQFVLYEKRKLSVDDTDIPSKKVKTDDFHSPIENCALRALLSAKSMQNKIELQILYECGHKDAPQRILQFLKNNLAK